MVSYYLAVPVQVDTGVFSFSDLFTNASSSFATSSLVRVAQDFFFSIIVLNSSIVFFCSACLVLNSSLAFFISAL